MTQPVAALMQKEMTRKEFLATMGLAGASILGFSSIVKLVTGKSLHSTVVTRGYGGSSYGK